MPSPRELQVILNADDFGLSDDTVAATIECFEAGALTSATLMPSMPATAAAVAFAAGRPELGFGVHLTFTADAGHPPLSDPELVPCLVGSDGLFLSAKSIRSKALLGRLVPEQIEREVEAQVRSIAEAGVPVSHVDSHRHVHKFAPFRAALARALPRLGIRRVRSVQDVYLRRSAHSPTYWLGHRWRDRIATAFETTDHFFMPAKDEPPWADALLAAVARIGGSLEVGVHPGYDEPWRDRDRLGTLELSRTLGDRAARVDWRTLVPNTAG
jgi:predicted glycoside hydrolase/deacetylase ChbG (UPF0249 family)